MKKRFLFSFLIGSLVLFYGCGKEKSLEGGAGPSEGTLQDGGTGDCLPKTVAGAYVLGTALVPATNYIEVEVDVTVAGRYTIYTDTVNGMYFRATGTFTATGLNTVSLPGAGTPLAAGIHNFVVSYGTSGCSIAVTTSATLGAFTFDGAPNACTGAAPTGTYTVGTDLTTANQVNININVTALGAYNVETLAANGMVFKASGVFTIPGAQALVLTGSGIPVTAGPTTIPITSPGGSNCSFTVTVTPAASAAVFTADCATATVNGTYIVGTALVPANNTISLPVTVTTAGSYTITATLNGMTFSASGTFATATAQTVVLAGTGTPTTQGANAVPVTGASAGCNVTVTVNPPPAGTAVYTMNCATATVNGTYKVGTALVPATNTISLPVTVTTVGSYTITATLNGMIFSASGSFATATAQTVVLAGTGNPTTQGANLVPVTGGTPGCNVTVNVTPAAGGAAVYTVDCSTAVLNGYLTKGVPVAPVNTIEIDVTVTTPGTYTITTTPVNGITYTTSATFPATGVVTVTLNGSGTPVNDGTFTINVPGTPACGFDVIVDPNMGTWSFKVGATTYSGTIYFAIFDNSSPPTSLFQFGGDDAAGNLFDVFLGDVNGTLANGETYKCSPPITSNVGGVYYDGVTGTSYAGDPFTPELATNTMTITLVTHNVATKTITATFSGSALLNGGTTLAAITNGTFTVTYP